MKGGKGVADAGLKEHLGVPDAAIGEGVADDRTVIFHNINLLTVTIPHSVDGVNKKGCYFFPSAV